MGIGRIGRTVQQFRAAFQAAKTAWRDARVSQSDVLPSTNRVEAKNRAPKTEFNARRSSTSFSSFKSKISGYKSNSTAAPASSSSTIPRAHIDRSSISIDLECPEAGYSDTAGAASEATPASASYLTGNPKLDSAILLSMINNLDDTEAANALLNNSPLGNSRGFRKEMAMAAKELAKSLAKNAARLREGGAQVAENHEGSEDGAKLSEQADVLDARAQGLKAFQYTIEARSFAKTVKNFDEVQDALRDLKREKPEFRSFVAKEAHKLSLETANRAKELEQTATEHRNNDEKKLAEQSEKKAKELSKRALVLTTFASAINIK